MKKLFLLLSIILITSSCVEKENDPMMVYSQDFTVRQWVWHPEQFYFYCDIDIPELSDYVFNYGVISTYHVVAIDGDEVIYPLPYDYYDKDGAGYRWTEQSTCEIYPGVIRFITKYDTLANYPTPPALTFRVKMMW
jgi:signal peptidase I